MFKQHELTPRQIEILRHVLIGEVLDLEEMYEERKRIPGFHTKGLLAVIPEVKQLRDLVTDAASVTFVDRVISAVGDAEVPLETEDDFFLMSNLSPASTGLPFVVWISQRGSATHDVRVKVTRSPKVEPGDFITVSVRPEVKILRGELRPTEFELLQKWINLNRDVLVKFWEGEIEDSAQALGQLRPLSERRTPEDLFEERLYAANVAARELGPK